MTAATFLTVGLLAGLAHAAIMAGAWLIQQRSGNSGWVDSIWSLSVGAVACVLAVLPVGEAYAPRQWIVAALAAFWSLRLGMTIAARSHGGTDDPRYAQLRKDWGDSAASRMFWFLQIQAVCALALSLSVFLAAHNPAQELRLQDYAGFVLLLGAILGETIADRQLKQFRADPANKGKVCDVGLWAWSRHPNYFFEWLSWCAYPLIAISLAGGYGWGWLALMGPALMYWLLVHASGIPPLEEHMLRSRGEAFRAYQNRVNAFFPAPPRA